MSWLREDVRALSVPAGTLLHDPRRWQLFFAPARVAPEALQRWAAGHGLARESPAPAVRTRIEQLFWVPRERAPGGPLRAGTDLRYGCIACGTSCRSFKLGPLTAADVQRLLAVDLGDPAGFFEDEDGAPIADARGASRVFLRRRDGACVFLRDDGLCGVHARYGAATKPTCCRAFPYTFAHGVDGVRVGLRLGECLQAARTGEGAPPDLAALERVEAEREEALLVPPMLWLSPGRLLEAAEWHALADRLAALPFTDDARRDVPAPLSLAAVRALEQQLGLGAPEPLPEGTWERALRRADELAGAVRGTKLRTVEDAALRVLPDAALRVVPDASRAHERLSPEALSLEARLVRGALTGTEPLEQPDLLQGVVHLALATLWARRRAGSGTAEALNAAWADASSGALRRALAEAHLDARAALARAAQPAI